MIVVDASALIAISEREPDAPEILSVLEKSSQTLICNINAVETGLILARRGGSITPAEFDGWLETLRVEVYDGVITHGEALDAYLRFGRGYHPARLNLGDAFAYALAKKLDAPLLYKGNDFALTDIRSAL